MKLRTSGLILAAVAATTLPMATSASAAGHVNPCAQLNGTPTSTAVGCFYPVGDTFKVQDQEADGRYPIVVGYTSNGRQISCANHKGEGKVETCDYDLWEKASVTFRLELRKKNSRTFKTDWYTVSVSTGRPV
ncbi:hypothetical protein [Streptomyces sp. NPDC056240]|uniref:hypothetical protein n=1 Tax=Streptomyces sp. NPDC056240 TaxID=3345759 RepID=UPI0035DCC1ED